MEQVREVLGRELVSERRACRVLGQVRWTQRRKRVERIWRDEGLKAPQRQPKRRRLWLNDASYVRLRPAYVDHGRTQASARSYCQAVQTAMWSARPRRSRIGGSPSGSAPTAWQV